ncbi:membrane protein DedA with SNARE-associated domain [Rhodococcus sp. SMB37]|uniref:DedA family protein n=1 Tax=Rhodococcus sp. SMB37 TaxID=2512213 RepID=UPI0006D0B75A|nr:DedA family protein [Rhodococcus sp. SMB37]TCN58475.1 membrane protein DedA with SNARE-associated domain [Rhodococcus sp. SMB37]
MDVINEFIIGQAAALWVYPLLFFVCVVDGFFPPVPSETILVTLASLSGSTGKPYLWVVIPLAALGAIVGDNIAYTIGRKVGTERFAWMRKPKARAAFGWARKGLDKRGAAIIITARYIPIGRIAVNMTAGATRYPRKKFVPLTIIGGITWAVYSSMMGRLVGGFFHEQPLLGAVVSICVAVVLGIGIDHVMQRLQTGKVDVIDETDAEPSPGSDVAMGTADDSEESGPSHTG